MKRATCILLLAVSVGLGTSEGYAADKALLVGIGKYRIKEANLKGIDRDLREMRRVAEAAGFAPENIFVLADRDATLAKVRIVFQRELIRGVSSDDRVLIYFSGHGTQVPDRNGDETDNSDEALLMHDTRKRYAQGEIRLENVLVDDEIEDLLAAVPAEDVLVLVDACHSGTVTRYLDLTGRDDPKYAPKAFWYDGMPISEDNNIRGIDESAAQRYNYIAMTASRDDQLAVATPEGSVFTSALVAVVDRAQRNEQDLSLADLHDAVGREIRNRVPPERLFTPQLSGDTDRAGRTMIVTRAR